MYTKMTRKALLLYNNFRYFRCLLCLPFLWTRSMWPPIFHYNHKNVHICFWFSLLDLLDVYITYHIKKLFCNSHFSWFCAQGAWPHDAICRLNKYTYIWTYTGITYIETIISYYCILRIFIQTHLKDFH